jgi:CopG family transcriptional regulator, nickel-responsive regulator
MNKIQRFGVSIDQKLLELFDVNTEDRGYENRSESIQDLIRNMLFVEEISNPETDSIGTLALVYSHDIREHPDKLNDISTSTTGPSFQPCTYIVTSISALKY